MAMNIENVDLQVLLREVERRRQQARLADPAGTQEVERQISELLDRTRLENDLGTQRARLAQDNAAAAEFLKEAVPTVEGAHDFLAWNHMFGNEHAVLAARVLEQGFHPDIQSRRFIAIVQAYGTGKTRLALQLAQSYVVLVWRTLPQSGLGAALVDAQKHVLDRLPQPPTFADVEHSSRSCTNLVHLALLAQLALFDRAVELGWIDPANPHERFLFALVQLKSPHLHEWARNWFLNQISMGIPDIAQLQRLEHVLRNRLAGLPIVFALDEPQEFFNVCRGYCLHFDSHEDPARQLERWDTEQIHGGPSCTDLFYQLRVVLLRYLKDPVARAAFVMCSTQFKTWRILETDNSPLSRNHIEKFYQLHWFSNEEVIHAVTTMFCVDPAWISDLAIADVFPTYFQRPLFTTSLLVRLARALPSLPPHPSARQSWFVECVQQEAASCRTLAAEKLRALLDGNPSTGVYSAQFVVVFLFCVMRLSAGVFALNPVEERSQTLLEHIITRGVARLDASENVIRIADQVHREVITEMVLGSMRATGWPDPVLHMLANDAVIHKSLIPQDHSSKGFVLERALAWLFMKNKVHDTLQVCSATVAGTHRELNVPSVTTHADLLWYSAQCTDVIVFPETLAGPDLWLTLQTPLGVKTVVAVQCKVWDTVFSVADLTAALRSVSPNTMFAAAARDEQAAWALVRTHLQRIHRVVFSARGFKRQAYHLVDEFNAKHPACPILLLSLEHIKRELGPMYDAMARQLSHQPDPFLFPNDGVMLQSEWLQLSRTRKSQMTKPQLKANCEVRDLPVSGTKDALVARLNVFDIDRHPLCSTWA